MTTDSQVTHPPVTHPESTPPSTPPVAGPQPEKPTPDRARRRGLRMPPPKILAAAALVVVALELLIWQVGGLLWGGVIHGGLLILAGLGLLMWSRWRNRRDARMARGQQPGHPARTGAAAGPRAGRNPLARLLGRRGASGGRSGSGSGRGGGAGRGGLLRRLTGGRRGGAGRSAGTRSGSGTGRARGLLSRLGRAGGAGRRAASGQGRAGGRAGGILGRLGGGRRAASTGRSTGATGGRRTGLRSALGRAATGGRALLTRSRGGGQAKRQSGGKPASRAARLARGAVGNFLRGVRQGAQAKPKTKPAATAPQPQAKPASAPVARHEKPQPPSRAALVKEAVEKVAKVKPAVVAPQRTRGTVVGDINKVRAAADELAAALKDYDPETMHQLVREMPQFGEALNAVQQGFRQVASRAESEWPVAAPVAEGLRSIADDIKAGAGTAEETRGTIRRENETDIERGEAPRHGSIEVERKWNV
ncbi:hypothetical protein [Micromonospora sp. DPT]|uniref:hypothetical protein n=1 Tax=Micromonospora sp. DPT TaxID=3142975 RepID=UPI003208780E